MGLPMDKVLGTSEAVEAVSGSGHAAEPPVAQAAKKGKGWFQKLTGVAP